MVLNSDRTSPFDPLSKQRSLSLNDGNPARHEQSHRTILITTRAADDGPVHSRAQRLGLSLFCAGWRFHRADGMASSLRPVVLRVACVSSFEAAVRLRDDALVALTRLLREPVGCAQGRSSTRVSTCRWAATVADTDDASHPQAGLLAAGRPL